MSSRKFQFSGLARPSLRGRSQSDHCSCVSSVEWGPYVRRPCARRVLRGCWEDTGWPALVRWLDGAVHEETYRGGAGADENPHGLFCAVHQVGSRRRESKVLCMAKEEQGRKKDPAEMESGEGRAIRGLFGDELARLYKESLGRDVSVDGCLCRS